MYGKSQSLVFQCLKKAKIFELHEMFRKTQNLEFQCLEKPKFRIAMFQKRQRLEFQCLKMAKFRIPIFGKAKAWNSNVWEKPKVMIKSVGRPALPLPQLPLLIVLDLQFCF